jgi:hypothetical protein
VQETVDLDGGKKFDLREVEIGASARLKTESPKMVNSRELQTSLPSMWIGENTGFLNRWYAPVCST